MQCIVLHSEMHELVESDGFGILFDDDMCLFHLSWMRFHLRRQAATLLTSVLAAPNAVGCKDDELMTYGPWLLTVLL